MKKNLVCPTCGNPTMDYSDTLDGSQHIRCSCGYEVYNKIEKEMSGFIL